jgi:translation initiation factor 1
MTQYRLVYSTDPEVNKQCPRCKLLLAACTCDAEPCVPDTITVRLQLEKAKRGGKTVTVLRKLPKVRDFLKDLSKELKQACGTGGTFGIDTEDGFIELQGDWRDKVREILKKKKFQVQG